MSVWKILVRKVIEPGTSDVYTSMNAVIVAPRTAHRQGNSSRARLSLVRALAARLVVTTVLAASLAWFLSSVAHFAEQTVVVSVMVAAFAASWFASSPRPAAQHRVTIVPARVRTR